MREYRYIHGSYPNLTDRKLEELSGLGFEFDEMRVDSKSTVHILMSREVQPKSKFPHAVGEDYGWEKAVAYPDPSSDRHSAFDEKPTLNEVLGDEQHPNFFKVERFAPNVEHPTDPATGYPGVTLVQAHFYTDKGSMAVEMDTKQARALYEGLGRLLGGAE